MDNLSLHTDAAAVNDPNFLKTTQNNLMEVFFDDDLDLSRLESM